MKEQKEIAFKKPIPEKTPHTIPYTDIEVSLGVPWVSAEIINDFVYHILNRSYSIVNGGYYKPNYVEHELITGNWFIREKKFLGNGNSFAEGKYGLKRYNALYIIEATLNLREIKLFDNGKDYNEADTLAALEKQKSINQEFKRWIWEDEDRRWLVEEAYNRAKTILIENREKLDALATILVEREVIFREDVENIYGKRPWDEEKTDEQQA